MASLLSTSDGLLNQLTKQTVQVALDVKHSVKLVIQAYKQWLTVTKTLEMTSQDYLT